MSNAVARKPAAVRRQRSIYRVHYSLERPAGDDMARPLVMPSDLNLKVFDKQVAGHREDSDTKYLGLLQCNNGTILKPILKQSQRREVDFYELLATCAQLRELRDLVPKYFGCKPYTYNGFTLEYIILEDLTERMLEPCIMDVKIGRRTWDPLAPEDKRAREQSKYAACKQQYAFCIPGYQVHRVATRQLLKYNKEHGKRLHGPLVRDAFRNFLNGLGESVCRSLLLQLVAPLWRAQRWAARASRLRLYSASLLIAYDAAKLRDCCGDMLTAKQKCRPAPPQRRKSIHSMHSVAGASLKLRSGRPPVNRGVGFPPSGVGVPTPARPAAPPATPAAPPPARSPWTEALDRLQHSHSFDHNYEEELSKIKMNYRATLAELARDSPRATSWASVKIIDFAHAFYDEDGDEAVDDNFKEGIDNVVRIFEEFLAQTEDQVLL